LLGLPGNGLSSGLGIPAEIPHVLHVLRAARQMRGDRTVSDDQIPRTFTQALGETLTIEPDPRDARIRELQEVVRGASLFAASDASRAVGIMQSITDNPPDDARAYLSRIVPLMHAEAEKLQEAIRAILARMGERDDRA
jgi:hypothetical protein